MCFSIQLHLCHVVLVVVVSSSVAGPGSQEVNHFQARLLVSNMGFNTVHIFSNGNIMRISV